MLSHDNFALEWSDLSFFVERKLKRKFLNPFPGVEEMKILDNVSGQIRSGSLTAILGASGAGKTTLLAALSQRIRGKLVGDIFVDGELMTRNKLIKKCGFVPQADIAYQSLTVAEHLYFMSEFKMDKHTSKIAKNSIRMQVLQQLGLLACSDTKIKMISGGEKRKLSLATELLTKPAMMFCDEVTTGLDSFNAYSVINTLRLLSEDRSSKAIVCSIHQPTSEVFQLFTDIILMHAGKIVYQGDVKSAENFFSSLGFFCPPMYNPAEYYVKLVSEPSKSISPSIATTSKTMDFPLIKISPTTNIQDFIYQNYKQIQHKKQKMDVVEINSVHISRICWISQFWLLTKRSMLDFKRDHNEYIIELLIFISLGAVIAMIYSNVNPNTQTAIQDIRGVLLLIATEVLFTFGYAVLYSLASQVPLLRREVGEHVYSLSAFYVSKTVLTIPRIILESFLFVAIVYFSTNLEGDFVTYLKISTSLALSGIAATAYGFLLSGLFESIRVATELSGIIDLVLLLFAGLYLNVKATPLLKYISFFFYANETIAINYWLNIKHIDCYENAEYPCLRSGVEVLEYFGFGSTQEAVYTDYIFVVILTIVTHLFGYFGIRKNLKKHGFY